MQNDTVSSPYTGHTLLEYTLIDVIAVAATKSSTRLRFSTNLGAHATRAVFAGTEETVSNGKLLRILRPKTVSGTVGRDTKEARNYRSIGQERGLKIDRIKMYVIALLANGVITNADAVRAWAYALINESVRLAIDEARSRLGKVDRTTITDQPGLANQLLNSSYDNLMNQVQTRFDKSSIDVEREYPLAEQRRFIDFAAAVVIEAMHQPIHRTAALRNILCNVYPELDSYEFA